MVHGVGGEVSDDHSDLHHESISRRGGRRRGFKTNVVNGDEIHELLRGVGGDGVRVFAGVVVDVFSTERPDDLHAACGRWG